MEERALELKQRQFNAAMDLYEKKGIYELIGRLVSVINISLQAWLLYLVIPVAIGIPLQIFSFIAACIVADLINGLVHMYMDGNDAYDTPAGPLIAAFHLHHRTPLYRKNNILLVYFNETGSKIWLVGYLVLSFLLIKTTQVHPVLSHIVVYVGILSSVAEVSHYCCHVSDSKIVNLLSHLGLFISKEHHNQHHTADNINYAFLNGFTDPLLNFIAERFSQGYKTTTDMHYAAYTGKGTANR